MRLHHNLQTTRNVQLTHNPRKNPLLRDLFKCSHVKSEMNFYIYSDLLPRLASKNPTMAEEENIEKPVKYTSVSVNGFLI